MMKYSHYTLVTHKKERKIEIYGMWIENLLCKRVARFPRLNHFLPLISSIKWKSYDNRISLALFRFFRVALMLWRAFEVREGFFDVDMQGCGGFSWWQFVGIVWIDGLGLTHYHNWFFWPTEINSISWLWWKRLTNELVIHNFNSMKS